METRTAEDEKRMHNYRRALLPIASSLPLVTFVKISSSSFTRRTERVNRQEIPISLKKGNYPLKPLVQVHVLDRFAYVAPASRILQRKTASMARTIGAGIWKSCADQRASRRGCTEMRDLPTRNQMFLGTSRSHSRSLNGLPSRILKSST